MMKKSAIVFLIVFCCSSVFAKMNLRVNVAVGASWEFYPAFNVDVLFTLKPKGSGFYFGAGPSCAFVFIHDDKKTNLALCPGIMLTGGFRF